jgi:type II secretory pathway component PulM
VNPRALWASLKAWYASHSTRDRRIILGVVGIVVLSLVWVGVVDPLRAYRASVAEEITEGQEQLERAARFVGAIDSLRAEHADLTKRLNEAKARLLPGDSGTLGAAALQERANALASEKQITVQSTQVMREETQEPFRKVAVRLTLTGELKPFADFVSGLEYGAQQLTIPFVELTRRGAVPGAKGPRTLSATVEVGGYLLASAKVPEPEPAEAEGEGATAEPEAAAGAAVPGEAPVPEGPVGLVPVPLEGPPLAPQEPAPAEPPQGKKD